VEISKFKLFADQFASDCIAPKWINSSYQLHHQQQLAEKVLIQTFDALDQQQQEAEELNCHWFALMKKEEGLAQVLEQFLMLFDLKSDWEE
jgi:hypothetical protein